MTIIHYFLGFPPMRSGGLVKYAIDLMKAEQGLGHNVIALFPGNFSLFSKKCYFQTFGYNNNIRTIKLLNALPIPLLYGIKNPLPFITERHISGFPEFIEAYHPDVFHVHTMMGLPKELLILMKKVGVKIVYTSHDYYGLCPKVNFINNTGNLCNTSNAFNCLKCCENSKGTIFLKFRNSMTVSLIKRIIK